MASLKMMLIGGAVLLTAGAFGGVYFLGEGEIHFVAPENQAVEIFADGKPAGSTEPGTMGEIGLGRGKHSIVLKAGDQETKYDIEVSGGMYKVLLPLEGQCFVKYDITDYLYGTSDATGDPEKDIRVKERIDSGPSELRYHTYYMDEETPDSVKDNTRVYSLADVPCEALKLPDAELIGFIAGDDEDETEDAPTEAAAEAAAAAEAEVDAAIDAAEAELAEKPAEK